MRLAWEPFSLPGAQFRAGLAGLCYLAREHIREDEGEISINLTKPLLAKLFGLLYESYTKPQRAKPDKVNWYPVGSFRPDQDQNGPWRELWRHGMHLWRSNGKYASLAPYKNVANEVDKMWATLLRGNPDSVSSCLYLGNQAVSGNGIKQALAPEHILLLHFVPVVVDFYELKPPPRQGSKQGEWLRVALIPDVEDPLDYAEQWTHIGNKAKALSEKEVTPQGRPRATVITMVAEAALAAALDAQQPLAGQMPRTASVYAYELYTEDGYERYMPSRRAVDEYAEIRALNPWSVTLRNLMLANALREAPLYRGFDKLVSQLKIDDLDEIVRDLRREKEDTLDLESDPWKLVARVVRRHLRNRAIERCRSTNEEVIKEYTQREAREFLLAVRGKRGIAATRAMEARINMTQLYLRGEEEDVYHKAAASADFPSMVQRAVARELPRSVAAPSEGGT